MNMSNINLQIIVYLMGVLLAINSGFMMIASIVSLIFDDGVYLKIFYSSISVLIFGLILMFALYLPKNMIDFNKSIFRIHNL